MIVINFYNGDLYSVLRKLNNTKFIHIFMIRIRINFAFTDFKKKGLCYQILLKAKDD